MHVNSVQSKTSSYHGIGTVCRRERSRRVRGGVFRMRSPIVAAHAIEDEMKEGHIVSHGYVKAQTKGGVIVELESLEDMSRDAGVTASTTVGFLPWQEAPISLNKKVKKHETVKELLPLGLSREFMVQPHTPDTVNQEELEYDVVVSARTMDNELLWRRMEQLFENCTYEKETFSVFVNGVNRGGLTAYLAGYPIFVPISQLKKREKGGMWDVESLQETYLRKHVNIALLEKDVEQRRIVCSEVKAIENDIIRQLEVGNVVCGRVRRIEKFGVFVGIEGTRSSALIHISNISGRHVNDANDVFRVGEKVHALIIGMDEDYSNISLSTAALESMGGEIVDDKQSVWDHAEENAEAFTAQAMSANE